MKRILCLVLAVLCCLPMLVGCNGDAVTLKLVQDGTVTIVYDATLQTADQMSRLKKKIESALEVEVSLVSSADYPLGVRANPNTILVGNLALEANQLAVESLRKDDFVVGVFGEYYVIGGKTINSVENAVSYFTNNVLENLGGSMKVSSADNHVGTGNYDINSMTVNGTPIYKYQIVTSGNATITEKRFAADLQTLFLRKTGYTLDIVKKSAANKDMHQIRIGSICTKAKTTEAHKWNVAIDDTALELYAESYYAYSTLRIAVQDQILGGSVKDVALAADYTLTGSALDRAGYAANKQGTIRVMFNNIWGSDTGDEAQRSEQLAELYGEYLPDVLGLQEFAPCMQEVIIEKLTALGYEQTPLRADKGYVPFNSSENGTTRDPLFYRKDVVEFVEYGYECMALLPEIENVTSAGAQQAIKDAKGDKSKSVNWAIFRVKATGEFFMVGSVHLWWKSERAADDAIRTLQMRHMRDALSNAAAAYLQSAGVSGTMPIFIGGDYNSNSNRASLSTMGQGTNPFTNVNGLLPIDKQVTYDSHHGYPTYNSKTGLWETVATPGGGTYSSAIDHIYLNSAATGSVEVKHFSIVTDEYAYLSSDHNALYIDFNFTAASPKQP